MKRIHNPARLALHVFIVTLIFLFCLTSALRLSLVAARHETPNTYLPMQTGQCLRYDQIQQRFIHNAFSAARDGRGGVGGEKPEQLLDMLIHHRARAIELDLHPGGVCGSTYPDKVDWFIYHDCFDITASNVRMLSDALEQLASFHNAQPQHEVVTVDLELGSLKSGKGSESEFLKYVPDQLDGLLHAGLGDALFTPHDLLTLNHKDPINGSLNDAVKPPPPESKEVKGWPTTDDLRGKFIFVMHGDEEKPGDVARYFGNGSKTIPNQRICFEIDERRWKTWTPEMFAQDAPHVVFHSELDFTDPARLRNELPGHILRIRQIDDWNANPPITEESQYEANMKAAQASGAHLLYMDIVPNRPYVRIHNDNFYPFGASVSIAPNIFPSGAAARTHAAVVNKTEPGSMLILGDQSGGDLDSTADKFVLARFSDPETKLPESWTAEIASASNYSVHSHSKGMIMARESTAPNSRYFAVGRNGDFRGLIVGYRKDDGGGTNCCERYDGGGKYRENWAFVKLELIPQVVSGKTQTKCRGYGSHTGLDGTWEQIGSDVVIDGALPVRGLAVCANSGPDPGRPICFLKPELCDFLRPHLTLFNFVNLRRSVNGGQATLPDLRLFLAEGIPGTVTPTMTRLFQPAISSSDIVVTNDRGRCDAKVDLLTALSGHCGAVTFNPPSGSSLPVGVTTVTATTPAGATTSFKVTVRDAEVPTIATAPDVAIVAPLTCPVSTSTVATYDLPEAADNCPGVRVACVPPSGSTLPAGTTTVVCTATDAAGNTASSSFKIAVYSACLQDDSDPKVRILVNTASGDYRFYGGGSVYSGTGRMTASGCTFALNDLLPDRRVRATFSTATRSGNATIQLTSTGQTFTVTDRDMANNNCRSSGGS